MILDDLAAKISFWCCICSRFKLIFKFSLFYSLQEGVEVRVARIFNTFGPRMHMNDGESDIRDCSFFILKRRGGGGIWGIIK